MIFSLSSSSRLFQQITILAKPHSPVQLFDGFPIEFFKLLFHFHFALKKKKKKTPFSFSDHFPDTFLLCQFTPIVTTARLLLNYTDSISRT